jgi:hypothetical protein
MALHRDSRPSPREMRAITASVPDIGRSLRLAREQRDLSLDEAAAQAGLPSTDIEAFESGTVGRMRDRVETLRSLRAYADSLGLPGHDYVLAVVDLWPTADQLPARAPDSGQVPVVSLTTAPAGGHSPPGAGRTGAAAFSVSGVVLPAVPAPAHDTGPVPIVDTGEIPAVKQTVGTGLKVLVGAAAVLVVVGLFTLTEHSHFAGWDKQARADSSHWIHNAKVAAGLAPKTTKVAAPPAPGTAPKVVMVQNPAADSVTVNVHAATFSVKMVAFKTPSWVQVTDSEQQAPIFQQVLAGGANMTFNVAHSLTIETGSASARAYIYDGTTFIGYYFPSKAPYTLTFNALG